MQPFDPKLGDHVLTSHAANGIDGEIISVRTSKGTRVAAWRCTAPDPGQAACYFAHGYSLQTHEAYGYSVISGTELKRVFADEYRRLGTLSSPTPLQLKRHDVLVWWNGPEAVHSAIVEVPISDSATRQLNEQATIVSSTSRSGVLHSAVSLAFVQIEHPSAKLIEAYRRA